MKPDPNRVKEIFALALEKKSTDERESALAEVCKSEPELRARVDSLLQAHEQAGDFLGQTVKLTESDFVIERTGTMIGRYKLLEKIGEGGFGVVYMAEQIEPLQRKVALKRRKRAFKNMNNKNQRGLFWWLFAITIGMSGFGLAGLLMGLALFPNSNLLGGLALIFGPFWMLGAPMLVAVTLAWFGVRVFQRLKRGR